MLTPAQQVTLKAYVEADPTYSLLPANNGSALQIANELNLATDPAFIVWRTKVTQDEIMQNGFDWTQADNLSVGQARIWEWLFANDQRSINPTKANVQSGITECWKGTTAKVAVATAVFVHCKRTANVVEKIFATGVGTTPSPASLGFEGSLTYVDVVYAMGWTY